jgi:hypothetical protein
MTIQDLTNLFMLLVTAIISVGLFFLKQFIARKDCYDRERHDNLKSLIEEFFEYNQQEHQRIDQLIRVHDHAMQCKNPECSPRGDGTVFRS